MSSYRILLVPSASKDYLKLEAILGPRLRKALEAIAAEPLSGKPLQGPYLGLRSFRVGEYRIVYRSDAESRAVVVRAIGHRRDIYR